MEGVKNGRQSYTVINGLIREHQEIEEDNNEQDREGDDNDESEFVTGNGQVFTQIKLTGNQIGQVYDDMIFEESFEFENEPGKDVDEPVMLTVLKNYTILKVDN